MEDLATVLRRKLQFPGGYYPVAYANAEALNTSFIHEVGEFGTTTETAESTSDWSGEVKPWIASVSRSAANEVGTTVEITVAQPETKALILRAAAERDGRLKDVCSKEIAADHYVEATGVTLFTGPSEEYPPQLRLEMVEDLLEAARALEPLRAYGERQIRRTRPEGDALAVVLRASPCLAGCIVNDRWLYRDVYYRQRQVMPGIRQVAGATE